MTLEGCRGYRPEDAEKYARMGWWTGITLGEMLDRTVEKFSDREALVDDRYRLTYAQLAEKVDRLAISLMQRGVKKGDCALLQLPNWGEWVFSYFALQKIGAVVVLLVAGYTQREVNHFCAVTGATTWIVPERHRKMDYLPVVEDVRKKNPALKNIIMVRGSESVRFPDLGSLIQEAELTPENLLALAVRSPRAAEVAHILPSGGTTGLPKLAPRTHNDYLCGVKYKTVACGRHSNEVCLTATPVGHNLALLITICGTIYTGAKMVLLDSSRPEDFCRIVQREKVTVVALVPALLRRAVHFDRLREYDLSSLEKIHVGAQHSPPDLIKMAYERLGVPRVISAFGMVEGLQCNTRLDDDRELIYTTVGRPCCPYDTFKVIDERERELPPNAEGELVGRGPSIFMGYLNTDSKEVLTGDGFVKTGDLATIDERGYVRITGRIKDIIIRGSVNISAAEVEEILIAHPGVEDVAVVGMPDEELGEKVCAYIQPLRGKAPGLEEIIAFLKENGVSRLMFPDRIEFVGSMPLTQVGKSDKKALREDIKRRLTAEGSLKESSPGKLAGEPPGVFS